MDAERKGDKITVKSNARRSGLKFIGIYHTYLLGLASTYLDLCYLIPHPPAHRNL